MSSEPTVLTLPSGSQIEIRETLPAPLSVEDEAATLPTSSSPLSTAAATTIWAAFAEAALVTRHNGRSGFYQSIHGSFGSPGWTGRTSDPVELVDYFLKKVEWLSRRGKMTDQVEILAALTPEQREKHVLATETSSIQKKSRPAPVKREEGPPAKAKCNGCSSLRARVSDAEAEIEELLEAVAAGQAAEDERDQLANTCAELRSVSDALLAENAELRRTAAIAASSTGRSDTSSEDVEACFGDSDMHSDDDEA